jgi:uncharacterized damage-inducible protein DinB
LVQNETNEEEIDMVTNELIIDSFERIKEVLHTTVDGLGEEDLTFSPSVDSNSIGWLAWHVARIQDDHIANASGEPQVWLTEWVKRFSLPFDEYDTGYGHVQSDVAAVKASGELLLGYYDAVHAATIAYVSKLESQDYKRVVDKHWDPPVTLAVRLVSVIADNLQHVGQATYVRGILGR